MSETENSPLSAHAKGAAHLNAISVWHRCHMAVQIQLHLHVRRRVGVIDKWIDPPVGMQACKARPSIVPVIGDPQVTSESIDSQVRHVRYQRHLARVWRGIELNLVIDRAVAVGVADFVWLET